MYWSRVQAFLNGFSFGQYMTYVLAVLGFVFGFKLKVIAERSIDASLIDGALLVLACALAIGSLILWILAEFLFRLLAPVEIRAFPTGIQYMASVKAGAYSEQYSKESFDYHSTNWNQKDASDPALRALVTITFGIALVLSALTFLSIFLSVLPLLEAAFSALFHLSTHL